MSFTKNPFRTEKPHSSITDWVEILTGPNIEEEAYDGIPELVDSINLQPGGPLEASRAIRKKLKHGNAHQQYRALVLLKALVENCGTKFLSAFSDGTLTDALRMIGADVTVNKRVKKKLVLVLSSWKEQYASEPSMALVAGLYKQCRVAEKREQNLYDLVGLNHEEEKRAVRKQEEKQERRKAKEAAKEKARKEEEERRRNKNNPKRVPFNFERDKPKVLECISEASQASSNLINAITLVNTEKESLEDNNRVQNCLIIAKESRKNVVRYIRLVENEELIGTLIETNERIMTALEMYDQIVAGGQKTEGGGAEDITDKMASANIGGGEVARLQQKQRAAIEAHNTGSQYDSSPSPEPVPSHLHPDLEDLDFGIGASSSKLPVPMRPKKVSDDDDEVEYIDKRGSLSDFSDYESSDEEAHKAREGSSTHQRKKSYVTVSDNGSVGFGDSRIGLTQEDPFADPFADSNATTASARN